LLARNPADAVDPPRSEAHEIAALDEQHSAWLLDAVQPTRLYIPVLLALTTGMRRGEILAVRWQDVNLSTGYVLVCRSLDGSSPI
jgi:integrase